MNYLAFQFGVFKRCRSFACLMDEEENIYQRDILRGLEYSAADTDKENVSRK